MDNIKQRLVVKRGPRPNVIYPLKRDIAVIGRDTFHNNIIIDNDEISRHHCRLTRIPEGFLLEDLGSTNGTFLNGKRIHTGQLLKDGDQIGLGDTIVLVYQSYFVSPHFNYRSLKQQERLTKLKQKKEEVQEYVVPVPPPGYEPVIESDFLEGKRPQIIKNYQPPKPKTEKIEVKQVEPLSTGRLFTLSFYLLILVMLNIVLILWLTF